MLPMSVVTGVPQTAIDRDLESRLAKRDIAWAKEQLSKAYTDEMRVNRAFFEGDHWQNGEGWVGPAPEPNAKNATEVLKLVERTFISKNITREVVQRHTNAVVGREISWAVLPADGDKEDARERTDIAEIEAALTAWWNRNSVMDVFQRLVDRSLWSGRGVLRLFIPLTRLDPEGRTPALTDLHDALSIIDVEEIDPQNATVYRDRKFGEHVGIYAWEDDEGEHAELVYVNDSDETVIRQLNTTKGKTDVDESDPLPLAGNLTMYELRRSPLITTQVNHNQRLLNMALTMMGRNTVLAGFLERTIINAQMPGEWVGEGPDRQFVPEPLKVGAGVTNILTGVEIESDDGKRSLAPVDVKYRDPVTPDTFIKTKGDAAENIYDEVKQRHVLIAGDAQASGVSRQQATADFESDIQRTKNQVDRASDWLLHTALALAALLIGRTNILDEYRIVSDARLRVTPASPDEQRVTRENRDAALISTETAMSRVGVEDVDAERQKIAAEAEEEIKRRARAYGELPDDEDEPDEDASDDDAGDDDDA